MQQRQEQGETPVVVVGVGLVGETAAFVEAAAAVTLFSWWMMNGDRIAVCGIMSKTWFFFDCISRCSNHSSGVEVIM